MRLGVVSGRVGGVEPEVEHIFIAAFPNAQVARQRGLSSNHHLRVWCTCQSGIGHPGGWSRRTPRAWLTDARRAGAWDELGVVDVRVPGSAIQLFRDHVKESICTTS